MLKFVNIHDPLEAKLLEIQTIGLIEVSRHSLGIVIDHDRPLAHVPQLPRTSDRTPIELDTAPNAINTTTKHHCSMLLEFNIMFRRIVGGIEIVRMGGIFGGKSVNPLDEGCDSKRFTVSTDGVFVGRDKVSYL